MMIELTKDYMRQAHRSTRRQRMRTMGMRILFLEGSWFPQPTYVKLLHQAECWALEASQYLSF